jgi:hypothetical protein
MANSLERIGVSSAAVPQKAKTLPRRQHFAQQRISL